MNGLDEKYIPAVAVDPFHTEVIYAGTGSGVYRMEQIVSSVKEEEAELPQAFVLKQNYPNPFNPSTTIEYALPQASDVTLVIYNLLGAKVRTLVQASQPAGIFSAVWDGLNEDAESVAGGIYFYKLKADSFEDMRRLVLIR